MPTTQKHAYLDPILRPQTAQPWAHLHTFMGSGCVNAFSNSQSMYQCPACCTATGSWSNTATCISACAEGENPLVDACTQPACTPWQVTRNETAGCLQVADPQDPSSEGVRICEWDADRSLAPGTDCARMCKMGENPAMDGCVFTPVFSKGQIPSLL